MKGANVLVIFSGSWHTDFGALPPRVWKSPISKAFSSCPKGRCTSSAICMASPESSSLFSIMPPEACGRSWKRSWSSVSQARKKKGWKFSLKTIGWMDSVLWMPPTAHHNGYPPDSTRYKIGKMIQVYFCEDKLRGNDKLAPCEYLCNI